VDPQARADFPQPNRRVLVTGGGGFVGWHLVDRLTRSGVNVTSLSRHPGRLATLKTGSTRFVPADLGNADAVIEALDGVRPDLVYHFASHPDGPECYEHARTTIQTNLVGTLNLLEAMRRLGGAVLVYGDSCKVYGNADVPYHSGTPLSPGSSYAISKAAGWELCQVYARLYGLTIICVRPTLMYGSYQGRNLISFVIRSVLAGKERIALDGGSQTRDPLYVDDGVGAFIAAGARGRELNGKVINIGGGHELSVAVIAQTTVDLMGSSIRIESRPNQVRATEMSRSYCDNREAAQWLGWRPSHTLEEGLKETIRYETQSHGTLNPEPLS
jgi:UDP-glucose 4-epimerase